MITFKHGLAQFDSPYHFLWILIIFWSNVNQIICMVNVPAVVTWFVTIIIMNVQIFFFSVLRHKKNSSCFFSSLSYSFFANSSFVILDCAILKVSSFFSIPINFLFSSIEATPVVPNPIMGSSTIL